MREGDSSLIFPLLMEYRQSFTNRLRNETNNNEFNKYKFTCHRENIIFDTNEDEDYIPMIFRR